MGTSSKKDTFPHKTHGGYGSRQSTTKKNCLHRKLIKLVPRPALHAEIDCHTAKLPVYHQNKAGERNRRSAHLGSLDIGPVHLGARLPLHRVLCSNQTIKEIRQKFAQTQTGRDQISLSRTLKSETTNRIAGPNSEIKRVSTRRTHGKSLH